MEWKLAGDEERAALKRIVALLFAFAGLAELAADRSPAVRSLVLWLLRHGANAARKLVAVEPEMPLASTPVVPAGDSAADAMRLAASLRALARQIDLQARLASLGGPASCGGTDRPASGPAMREVLEALSALAALALPMLHPARPPDTS